MNKDVVVDCRDLFPDETAEVATATDSAHGNEVFYAHAVELGFGCEFVLVGYTQDEPEVFISFKVSRIQILTT